MLCIVLNLKRRYKIPIRFTSNPIRFSWQVEMEMCVESGDIRYEWETLGRVLTIKVRIILILHKFFRLN